jgi:hypothetical protein
MTVFEKVTLVVSQPPVLPIVPPPVVPPPVLPPVRVVTGFPGVGPLKLSHEIMNVENIQTVRTIYRIVTKDTCWYNENELDILNLSPKNDTKDCIANSYDVCITCTKIQYLTVLYISRSTQFPFCVLVRGFYEGKYGESVKVRMNGCSVFWRKFGEARRGFQAKREGF